uniref:transmembrane protein 174 n=1 Tax=Centroberyx gerrardi TaxID=166262 RepID=UPI003AAF5A1F
MMRQSPQMETRGARNPVIVIGGASDGLTQNDTSVRPSPARSDGVLDGEKTGATLLFFGISLGLLGMVFMAVGWLHHPSHSFESTQLLGPVLFSVGGAFMLTSVCRFGVISCQCCRQRDEEEDVMSKMEQIPTGHSPVFNGVSQPIMFHGAMVMQDIPPPYASETLEVNPTSEFQPSGSVNGIPLTRPPPYDVVFPVPMEVRLDEHAIIRSSRPGSVGLRVQARSWDSLAFISIQWEKLISDERWDPLSG